MKMRSFSLQILILFCYLTNYGLCEWSSCPFNPLCSCVKNPFNSEEVKEINCTEVPFIKLPNFSNINDINELKIIGSGLKVLEDDSFSNAMAKTIILDNNHIHSLPDKVFFKMNRTLEELSLNFNDLDEIPINALQYMEKLRSIMLNRNQISSVMVNWSNLLNSVQELSLAGNELHNLPLNPDVSLMNMKSLSSINLAENSLLTLESNSLPISLKKLNISNNNIKLFPQLLLNNLQELQYLILSDNLIDSISSFKYEGKISLEQLDLSRNLLESFGKYFSKGVTIKRINLSYNKIGTVEKESLSNLEIKKIDLSYNKLSKLEDQIFNGLENTLEYVDLSNNRFTKFPESLKSLKSLETLKLDHNHLMILKDPLSFLKEARKLSLAGNKLGVFPYEAVGPLKSLYSLDVGYNRIADLRRSDFKSWATSLEKLFLQSNSILFIENNTFEHASRLNELSLSYNSIGSIDNDAFKYLDRSLQKMVISFGLKGFGFPNAFFTLRSLKLFAVDNNNINSIPEAISNLESLETLILDFNGIKELKSVTFNSNSFKYLREVRLSFNKIQKIESSTFVNLKNLENIGLHNNKIIKISEHSFGNLSQALSIYLSNNEIEIIEVKSFSNIPKLKKADLHGNKLLILDYTIFENVTTENEPMTLNISQNRIEIIKVPSYQRNPVYINILDLSHNKITTIPEKIVEIQTSLKSLDLSYNEIASLESQDFYSMTQLEYLCLIHNKIVNIKSDAFISLKKLQILNMAHNHIENIQNEQFKDLENLRILDLSFNNIFNIPSNAFANTKVEKLSISNNKISALHSSFLNDIKTSLRSIDLSHNQILNIDSNIFDVLPKIYDLNLCHNKITGDSLNALQNSITLSDLELCGNELVSIVDGSFKNITNLRYLNLAETGLQSFPNLTFPNLKKFNVSGNRINNIKEISFTGLPKLKVLNLSSNQLTELNNVNWVQLQNLKSLDIANNPIKVIDQSSFNGLYALKNLNLQKLNNLEVIDPLIFMNLVQLSSLKLHITSSTGTHLPRILSNLEKLRELVLEMTNDKLTDQLPEKLPRKLKFLEITGKNLKSIDSGFLNPLKDLYDLKLKISGTSIKHLPKHLLSKFRNKKFMIDLTDNELSNIGPEVFYNTIGDIRRYGTKAFPGGLHIGGNPLVCGCNTKWLAQWLRRYLTETLDVNSMSIEQRLNLIESMNQVVCYHGETKQMLPILFYDVTYDEVLCVFVLNLPKVSTEKGLASLSNINIILLFSALLFPFFGA